MELAVDQKNLDKIHDDLTYIESLMAQSADFRRVLVNPVIKEQPKKDLLRTIFAAKVSSLTMDFLFTLCEKNRETILPEIFQTFKELREEHLGLIPAEVVSVVDLTPEQVRSIEEKLKTLTGKTPQLTLSKDPALIGGVRIQIGDRVIDGSVRRQLERLHTQLAEAAV
jgi:F-type H+-transporting ATPase subunit delta